jgi:hypothetical protein
MHRKGEMPMGKFFGVAVVAAAVLCGGGQGVLAQGADVKNGTVLWPDVTGKMVRIPIAYTIPECLKNGRNLGYPDAQTKDWCAQHCNGKICQ